MSEKYPFIISPDKVTVIADGNPITVSKTDGNYAGIVQAIKDEEWDLVKIMCNKPKAIHHATHGELVVKDGAVYYSGEQVHNYVVDRILEFVREGIDADPLIRFLEKLMQNPSKRCVDDLFSFLEHGNMPVDPDGDFYAYKAVGADWLDKHSGTIRNEVGDVVEVLRNQVDDDPNNSCSHGLHAGSLQYVNSFAGDGDRIILVKINPKDVVSVPAHDVSKLRCCRYEVSAIYKEPLPNTVYHEDDNFAPDDESIYNDDWEDDGCCCSW
jgi:hypothetical protein